MGRARSGPHQCCITTLRICRVTGRMRCFVAGMGHTAGWQSLTRTPSIGSKFNGMAANRGYRGGQRIIWTWAVGNSRGSHLPHCPPVQRLLDHLRNPWRCRTHGLRIAPDVPPQTGTRRAKGVASHGSAERVRTNLGGAHRKHVWSPAAYEFWFDSCRGSRRTGNDLSGTPFSNRHQRRVLLDGCICHGDHAQPRDSKSAEKSGFRAVGTSRRARAHCRRSFAWRHGLRWSKAGCAQWRNCAMFDQWVAASCQRRRLSHAADGLLAELR